MKTDVEIGLEVSGHVWEGWKIPPERAAELGAAARKAVGERPRMMIEGMSVAALVKEVRAWATIESIFLEVHRLANTPVPVVDPDALAKELLWAHYTAAWPEDLRVRKSMDEAWKWITALDQNVWRAVAKMMEERK